MFDVTVPRFNNPTLVPVINKALPNGTSQTILLFGAGAKGATLVNDATKAGTQ